MIIKIGFLNNLAGSIIAGTIINLTFGNLNSWSSPVLSKLNSTTENPFDEPITTAQGSLMSSLVTVGAVVGCWFFGYLSDTIGRKISFIFLGLPMTLGFALMVAIHKVEVFYTARFLQGMTMGGGFNIVNIYLGEICSRENRGTLMSIVGMMNSAGSLISYTVGPYVSVTMFNAILMIFPIIFIGLTIIFCEESPYFYLLTNKEELARKALETYRGANYNCNEEIQDMKAQIRKQNEGNIINNIKTMAYLKSFIIGNVLLIAQQLTGINGILMYSETIFNLTGSSFSPALCSMILAAIQLLSGAIAPFIVNKFGRIPILITSGIGMSVFEFILGIYCILKGAGKDLDAVKFLPLLTLTGFMLSYNFGFGPLCWIVPTETYPTRVKSLSMSVSISVYFGVGFFIAQYFNSVVDAIGIGAIFIIFAGCCLASCLFIKLYVIETKGKSLEEIQDILEGNKSKYLDK